MSIKTYREEMQMEQLESLMNEIDKVQARLLLIRMDFEELKEDIEERKKQLS